MERITNNINWKEFLSQHDLIWDNVRYQGGYYPTDVKVFKCKRRYRREWEEGAFIGNGMTGAMIYKESLQAYRWELGRNDVVAHNFLNGIDWAKPRVPIGDLVMIPTEKITSDTMHLRLWDAQVTGEIETEKGRIQWQSFNHALEDVMVIEVKSSDSENMVDFGFRPKHGVSPRIQYAEKNPDLCSLPPEPTQMTVDGINLSIQTFVKEEAEEQFVTEGECAVAWKEVILSNMHKLLYLSITNSYTDHSARKEAVDLIKQATKKELPDYEASHLNWWHNYYPKSYVSLSDKKWEKFYWIQMYKLACAMREDGVVLDSQGPWLTVTPWPTTVWNLNVQLSYMSIYTANRAEFAESLINTLKNNKQTLIDNAKPMGIDNGMYVSRATNTVDLTCLWPDTRELGNLTWALQSLWRYYCVKLDEELVTELIFPYLKANMNCYLHLMTKGEDGKYHLPNTSSPEYPSIPKVNHYPINDCNYSLALFRWGCETLLYINDTFKLQDGKSKEWQDVIDNLADFPTDENGYMVGSDVPFARSHRHYSHLFMIYPLNLVDLNNDEERELAERSIKHWLGLADALQGYTFTGAAAMAAYMKDGDQALEYLNGLDQYLFPNTMYAESGPVIETPLSAAESIHNMLLQSHTGVLDVFPATPKAWEDISFDRLLAEGAFEISAELRDGVVTMVKVKSLKGEPLTIQPNMGDDVIIKSDDETFNITQEDNGLYIIKLKQGHIVTFNLK